MDPDTADLAVASAPDATNLESKTALSSKGYPLDVTSLAEMLAVASIAFSLHPAPAAESPRLAKGVLVDEPVSALIGSTPTGRAGASAIWEAEVTLESTSTPA